MSHKELQKEVQLLAEKQFKIAEFYQKTGNTDSAGLYFQAVVEQWPKTSAGKISERQMKDTNQQGEKVENE